MYWEPELGGDKDEEHVPVTLAVRMARQNGILTEEKKAKCDGKQRSGNESGERKRKRVPQSVQRKQEDCKLNLQKMRRKLFQNRKESRKSRKREMNHVTDRTLEG